MITGHLVVLFLYLQISISIFKLRIKRAECETSLLDTTGKSEVTINPRWVKRGVSDHAGVNQGVMEENLVTDAQDRTGHPRGDAAGIHERAVPAKGEKEREGKHELHSKVVVVEKQTSSNSSASTSSASASSAFASSTSTASTSATLMRV